MALFTSVASGDFDAAATWDVGVGFPGSGDTFAIVAGHTVTIPVGLSATSSGTLTGTGTGTRAVLVINGSLKLTGGDLAAGAYNRIEMGAGSTLDLNGNDLAFSVAANENNQLHMLGTSGSRVKVISTIAGGGIIRAGSTEAFQGDQIYQNVDFTDCGTIRIGSNFASGASFLAEYLTFTGCGETTLGGHHNLDNDYIVRYIDFRDDVSLTANIAIISRRLTGSGAGGQAVLDSVTAAAGSSDTLRMIVENLDRTNFITSGIKYTSVTERGSNLVDSFADFLQVGVDDAGIDGVIDSYLFSAVDNPHTNPAQIDLLDSCIIEATYSDGYTDDGDHFIVNTTRDQTVQNCLLIESKSGVLVNALGVAKTANYVGKNNTLVGNYDQFYGALARTEGGGSFAGTLNLTDNLIVNVGVSVTAIGMNFDTAGDDQVTTMDFNSWVDIATPYSGVTSATKTPGVTVGYGGNDLTDIDPQFLDSTRNLAKWAFNETGTQTEQAGIDHLLAINGYDAATKSQIVANQSGALVTALMSYVREGFAPTNADYLDNSSTGGFIGAVDPIISAGGGTGTHGITALDYVNRTNYYIN